MASPFSFGLSPLDAAIEEEEKRSRGFGLRPQRPGATGSGETRGLRNNNPLNIEAGDFAARRPGFVGSDGRFAQFETPEAGAAAADDLLRVYGRQGISSISGVIGKWAPASDGNDVDSYVSHVAGRLGIGPDDPLDLTDPKMRKKLASAMAEVESGKPLPMAEEELAYEQDSEGRLIMPLAEAQRLQAEWKKANPPRTTAGNAKEFVKGVVPGAVSMVGSGIAGLANYDLEEAVATDIQKWKPRLAKIPDMTPAELDGLRADIKKMPALTRRFISQIAEDLASGKETVEGLNQYRAPIPVGERPLAKVGGSIEEFSKTILPTAKGYDESWGRTLGEGVGSLLAGVGASLVNPTLAGAMFTSSGAREAQSRAAQGGATPEEQWAAGLAGSIPGSTDVLPVEILLSRIPVPIRSALMRGISRIGVQATVEGIQEGGQQFLQNLIARETYKPSQALGQDVGPSAGAGAGVGGLAEVLYAVARGVAGRRGGHVAAPGAGAPAEPEDRGVAAGEALAGSEGVSAGDTGPLGRAMQHGEEEARATVGRQEAQALIAPPGAPNIGTKVTVTVPGLDPFAAVVDSYDSGEVIVADQHGEVFQVPVNALAGQEAAPAAPAEEPAAGPSAEQAAIPEVPASEMPEADMELPTIEVGAEEKPAQGAGSEPPTSEKPQETAEKPEAGNSAISGEAAPDTSKGMADQFVVGPRAKRDLKARGYGDEEIEALSPADANWILRSRDEGPRPRFPDEAHKALYEFGRRRQMYREGGGPMGRSDILLRPMREKAAEAMGVPLEEINVLADDYRHKVDKARKGKLEPVDAPVVERKAEAADDATWWDKNLTAFGRREILAKAGVKRPDKVLWQHLSEGIQTKLRPYRTAEEPATVDAAAQEAATSVQNDKPQPTAAEKKAGKYEKGEIEVGGIRIDIENPAGSTREGKGWSQEMKGLHYGEIPGVKGKDKDWIDVFVKEGTQSSLPDDAPVFVIDQKKASGAFDEHKPLIGWQSGAEARRAYLMHYPKGWDGIQKLTPTTLGEFKAWLKEGDTTKPFAEGQKPSESAPTGQNSSKSAATPKTPETVKNPEPEVSVLEEKPAATKPEKPAETSTKKAKAPKREKSDWTQIGKNRTGHTLYEDQRGVRSYIENGVRITEPVGIIPGGGISLKPREGTEWDLVPENTAREDERPAGPRVVVNKVGRDGKTDAERGGPLPPEKSAPDAARGPHYASGYRDALAGEVRALPSYFKDSDAPGAKKNRDAWFAGWDAGNAARKAEQAPEPAPAPEKPAYGSTNQLVTADRAAEVRKRLRAKLRGQLSAGIDPEIVALGAELAVFHIEAGARRFADMAKAVATDLGTTVEKLRPYLRAWYNSARDLMEDSGVDVAGMDDPATVKAQAAVITGGREESDEPRQGELEGAGPEALGREPADTLSGPEGGGDAGIGAGRRGGEDASGASEPRSERPQARRGVGDGTAGVPVPPAQAVAGDVTDETLAEIISPQSQKVTAADLQPGDSWQGIRGQNIVIERTFRQDGRIRAVTNDGEKEFDTDAILYVRRGPRPPSREPTESAATPAGSAPSNYVLSDADNLGAGGEKTKFRQNIAAIKVLRGAEHRLATPEEQAVLAKYVGWGGLAAAFPREDGSYRDGWENEGKELKALLSPEEYAAARASTQNAHYTSPEVVKAMWSAMERLGFRGGRLLEPSVGTGNFLGFMPPEARAGAMVDGVELDRLTAAIAEKLYPDWHVMQMGFQDFHAPAGWYDAVIGNPPFGAVRVYDRRNKAISRFTIHNFFFAKSIDMVRPDGVVAMVVTNFMMDASRDGARDYITKRTELLGAIRLPNDAFAKNAGTEVTTDIIFLRKLKQGEAPTGETWLDAKPFTDKEGRQVLLNEYFHRHPEQMLGEFGAYGEMYAKGTSALIARPGQDTPALLAQAIARLPQNIMPEPGAHIAPEPIEIPHTASEALVGSMFLAPDGKVWERMEDIGDQAQAEPVDFEDERKAERAAGLIEIRDAFAAVRRAQLRDDVKDAELDGLRKALNEVYDRFVKKNGPVNADANKRVFREDPTWPQVSALEEDYDRGISATVAKSTGETAREPSAKKAPVFFKRTQSPYRPPTSAASAKDALTAVLADVGHVDMAEITHLYGKSEDEVVRELGDLIYKNPAGGYETRDHYLSGNVKQKYALAERAAEKDPQYRRNIEALRDAIPADIAAVDINVKPGSHWIPPKHVADFANHAAGVDATRAQYVPANATWTVDFKQKATDAAQTRFGTRRVRAEDVIAATLNGKRMTVYDRDRDGTSHVNPTETDAANAKVELVKEEWRRWIWGDDARREELHRLYNDSFNTDRRRVYDGSHLTLPGKVGDDIIELRPSQADAVWRIVQSGTTLLDHTVGAGKTFTMVAGAMEMRRMGLAKKPMFVVPNHLVGQWAASFIQLYPGANILAASKKDFEAENRKRLFARMAAGDYDAVIVAHSSFGKIGVDPVRHAAFIEEQVADLEASIAAVQAANGGKKDRSVKQLEKARDNLRAKWQKLLDSGAKDEGMTFEELGVDALFVDEAHEFKNLAYSTSMQRVLGLGNQAGSQKAADLYIKVQSVLDRTNGRNVVFATGTPISNTMAEMFTMQRYLDGRELKRMGLSHFDAWARMFGEVVSDWELSAAGKYKLTSRFSKFVNIPELMQRYVSFSDVINNDDIKRQMAARGKTLPLPKVKGGKPQNLVVERSKAQAAYIGEAKVDENGNETYAKGTLIWRSENLPKGPPQKGDDNMLKIMSDARKAALDMRLIDPSVPDDPNSKVNKAADEIMRVYRQWDAHKGAQLVFCDLSTPKAARSREADKIRALMAAAEEGDEAAQEKLDAMSPDEFLALDGKFSVYDDLRQKLIDRGIPANEIAFIHSANTDPQKEDLFGKVRTGRVRVLMGSTAKMGAGTNVQDRLVALHHLDAPWRPSDLEQREGRIIRQGNKLYALDPEGFEVEVNRYATKGTLDARMWQVIEGKARFIEQVRKGDGSQREIEDVGGEAANAAEMKAAASGNPLILEEMDLRQQLRKLDTARYNHDREQYAIRDALKRNRSIIEDGRKILPLTEEDAADVAAMPDRFAIVVAGETFEKPKDAGTALLVEFGKFKDSGADHTAVGKIGPFKLAFIKSHWGIWLNILAKARRYDISIDAEADATGLAMRVKNRLAEIAGEPDLTRSTIAKAEKEIPELEKQVRAWPDAEKAEAVKARHEAVIAELRPKKAPAPAAPAPATDGDSQTLGSTISRAPVFYSALLRAVEAADLKKGTAGHWLGFLKNAQGVKQEELDWLGVADWLKAQNGPVSREALADFIRANQIEVIDDVRGEAANNEARQSLLREWDEWLAEHQFDGGQSPTDLFNGEENAELSSDERRQITEFEDRFDALENEPLPNETRWGGGDMVLPGGENYRELVLTLPRRAPTKRVLSADQMADEGLIDANTEAEGNVLEVANDFYHRAHWGDTANPLAHVRFNERTDADGKRTLFIEEIQSDWHQAGRKRGYKQDIPADRRRALEEEDARLLAQVHAMQDARTEYVERGARTWNPEYIALQDRRAAIRAELDANYDRVPDAPFKTTWPELTLKRMIRWAAENGFDQVAWTPGIEQVKRWEAPLRQQVNSITWREPSGGKGLGGREVFIEPKSGTEMIFGVSSKGIIETAGTSHRTAGEVDAIGQPLEEVVGKETARRILEEVGGRIEGDNLTIGGKGFEDFYDKILVNAANKLGKKFGAKVGRTKIELAAAIDVEDIERVTIPGAAEQPPRMNGTATMVTVHSLPITPAMRAAVMQGQPLFRTQPGAGLGNTRLTEPQKRQLDRFLRAKVKAIAGKDVMVWTFDTLAAEGAGDEGYRRDMGEPKPGETAGGVATMYGDGRAIVRLALADPGFSPLASAYHEAYHRVEGQLMTDEEYAAVDTPENNAKARVAAALELGIDPKGKKAQSLPGYEARAIAFERYTRLRDDGMPIDKANLGLPATVQSFFEKLHRILQEVRRILGKMGYRTLEDVFEDVYQGRFADREAKGLRDVTRHNEAASVIGSTIRRPTKESIVEAVDGKLTDLTPAILATVPLNYFPELARPNMEAVPAYLRLKRLVDAYRGRKHAEADDIGQEWMKLGRYGKEEPAKLADLMHSSTLAQTDPTKTTREEKQKPEYARLRAKWDALTPNAQALFVKVRDAYLAQSKELDKILLDNVRKSMEITTAKAERRYKATLQEIKDSGLKDKEKDEAEARAQATYAAAAAKAQYSTKARLAKLRQSFENRRAEGPYFPLARFGQYFVTVRDVDGSVISFSRREKAADRNRLAREMKAAYPQARIEVGVLSNRNDLRRAMDPRLLAEIDEILGRAGVEDTVMDEIWQRYLETMPDISTRKRFIHRKGTAGFEGDALRAFGSHMFHAAHQMAKLKYGAELQELVEVAKDQAREADDPTRGMLLANELAKRHEWVMNPTGSKAAQVATSASFVWYLAATPAAAIVNLSQTAILGIPILGARFGGVAKASAALLKASKDFAAGRGSTANANLPDEEKRAIAAFYDSGLVDRTQSHDLAGVGETGIEYSPLRTKVMGKISWMFHHAERFNREVTALASFRLARASGQDYAQAVETAHDLTWKTHFDYSNSSRPRVMQNDVAKIALVFRNYQINMLYRLFRDIHQSFKGETKEARREARFQLTGIMGMMALSAGVRGVPFFSIAMILLGLLFDDDDDPMTFRERFRGNVIEALGPELGGIVLNGVPGHYLGIDLTNRIGMPDLWFRSEQRDLEGKDEYFYWVSQVLGAAPGIFEQAFNGVRIISEGNVERGVEYLVPKAIKDLMKSWRFANEGATTLRGDQYAAPEDIDAWDIIAQAVGFTPAVLVETYERNNALKNAEKRIVDRRRELLNRYALATRLHDGEARAKVQAAIREFNRVPVHKGVRITSETLKRSLAARKRNTEKFRDGVMIQNKGLDRALREMLPEYVYR